MSDHFLQLVITQTWQIAALAIIVATVVRIAARNRPHLAHALWILVLIKCVTPPIWGHSLGVFSRVPAWTPPVDVASPLNTQEALIADDTDVPVPPADSFQMLLPDNSDAIIAESDENTESSFYAEAQTDLASLRLNASALEIVPLPLERETQAAEPASLSTTDTLRTLLFFGLIAGMIITLLTMVVRCLHCLRQIHRHRTTEFDDALRERILQLAKQLRMRRIPRIIVSDVIFGPAVLGLLRHTIVLPRCLFECAAGDPSRSFLPERTFAARRTAQGSTSAQRQNVAVKSASSGRVAASREVLPGKEDLPNLQFLDPILAHELLHIRRGDLRTGTLQAIVQSLWWFHPAVWFCNRWLSREAERCCDEQVIAELGCSPAQYARSLLSVIECKHRLQPIPVFPGMKPVEITTQRMERIMSLKHGLKKRTPIWCWLMILALAFVVLPGATPAVDEKPVVAEPSVDETESEQAVEDSKSTGEHKCQVQLRTFEGNKFLSDESLRKHLVSEKPIWSLVGEIYSDAIPAETKALSDYYQSVGFFDVKITGKALYSRDRSDVCLAYTVTEGTRYTIRKVRFEGNNRVSASDLQHVSNLKPGDKYDASEASKNVQRIRDLYKSLGLEPAAINRVPHFCEESGVLDLVIEIDEGLKALIRLDEAFIPSPGLFLTGETILTFVGDKKIALADISMGILSQLDKDTEVTPEQRQQILLATVIQRLPRYLHDEVVLHEFHRTQTPDKEAEIRESLKPAFSAILQTLSEDMGAKDTSDLERMLQKQGFSIEDMRDSFMRRQIIAGYLKSLPAESPLRDPVTIENYCRQLLFDAGLRNYSPAAGNGTSETKDVEATILQLSAGKGVTIFLAKNGSESYEHSSRIRSVSDFDSEIVSVKGIDGDPKQIRVHARNPGRTELQIKDEHGQVHTVVFVVDDKESMAGDPLVLMTYSVADLVVPLPNVDARIGPPTETNVESARAIELATAVEPRPASDRSDSQLGVDAKVEDQSQMKADFAPLMELIKATVEPESWQKDLAVIVENQDSLSLVIRQTQKPHDEIQNLLSQLRNAQDQTVRIQSLIVKLTDEAQAKWLEENCSLHPLPNGNRWALLPQQRSESFTRSLMELKPEVLSTPRVLTIAGQKATIQVGAIEASNKDATGFRLEMTPQLVPDSQIIRLQHSFSVGSFEAEMPRPVDSLVSSGQTLLLLATDPEATANARPNPSYHLLMLTPQRMPVPEEKSAQADRNSAATAESTSPDQQPFENR